MSTPNNPNDDLVISYLTLRKAVGLLGILLSPILVAGSVFAGSCEGVQLSVSNYYHTNMGDFFVGILCAISLFFFSYKGYDSRDNIAAKLACALGLCVALFPTSLKVPLPPCNIPSEPNPAIIGTIHLVSAGLFLLVLTYFSLFLFTKSGGEMTPEKKKRNVVYKVCGYLMLVCVLILIVYFAVPSLKEQYGHLKPVFILETIALTAFGTSWLVKGEFILKDK